MEQGTRTPLPKRKRGAPDTEKPEEEKRLYLIFDDWAWGYSIRALELSPPFSTAAGAEEPPPLPPPFVRLEAPRGSPWNFAAVGTRIVLTHRRNQVSVPDCFLPILDVRSRGITFGPGHLHLHLPIYVSVGADELFALSTSSFKMLSLEKLWPPRLEVQLTRDISEWTWRDLPEPPFCRMDVSSHALHSDGRTILFSTDKAAFAFDTKARVWEQFSQLNLPFRGHSHFVPALNAYVGISPDNPHLLRSCKLVGHGRDEGPVWKVVGEELLQTEGPCELHVIGATLVYLGGESGTEFCLVQCLCTEDPYGDDDSWGEEDARKVGVGSFERVKHNGCVYRLVTFSLAYDDNGALTTGKTCLVRSYNVPEETTEAFVADGNPVAFWM